MTDTKEDLQKSNHSAARSGSVVSIGPRLSTLNFVPGDSPFIVENLTSDVFNEDNPPMDWADAGLLIPHEAIRRQMAMMTQSAAAMPDEPVATEGWKLTLFAKWYIDYFYVCVEEHHDAEEKIYFPWLKEKTQYPEKEFSKSHEELIKAMGVVKDACQKILNKRGKGCAEEVKLLKEKIPTFETDMRAHLKEEEETVPDLVRNNYTQAEEGVIVEKIIQAGGLAMTKKFLPAILMALQEWATKGFYDQFVQSIPPPIRHLLFKYYIPDYENYTIPMRDAPTMEKEPKLSRIGCCGISFCFPCIL